MTKQKYIEFIKLESHRKLDLRDCCEECAMTGGRIFSRQILAVIKVFSDRIEELDNRIYELESKDLNLV